MRGIVCAPLSLWSRPSVVNLSISERYHGGGGSKPGTNRGGFDMQGIIMQGSRYWSRTWMQLLGLPGDDSRMIGALGRLGRMHGFGVWMYRGRRVDSSPSGTSSSYAVSSDEWTGAINSHHVNHARITFFFTPP